MPIARRFAAVATVLIAVAIGAAPAAADRQQRVQRLQKVLDHLVDLKGGPPGASAVLLRGDRERLVRAGVADVDTGKPFTRRKNMRIASVAKAFSGAVALSLVDDGFLSLDDTIGSRLPTCRRPGTRSRCASCSTTPAACLTTPSRGFRRVLRRPPARRHRDAGAGRLRRATSRSISRPGSEYQYSNTDNIVVALMAEAGTGDRLRQLLRREVSRPLGLKQTDLPPAGGCRSRRSTVTTPCPSSRT